VKPSTVSIHAKQEALTVAELRKALKHADGTELVVTIDITHLEPGPAVNVLGAHWEQDGNATLTVKAQA